MKPIEEVVSDNIKKILRDHDLNQSDLAKIAGVSESTVGKWVLKKAAPRMGAIEKISQHFGLPKSYILKEDSPTNVVEISPATVRVPVLGKIACGDPILAEENIKEYRNESPDLLPSGNSFYLEAFGDSMEPTIPNGSLVLIREQPSVEYGEIAAVLVNGNEEATLKRVRKQGNMVMLMPDNPTHDPYIITEDNPAKIIGKAIRVTLEL